MRTSTQTGVYSCSWQQCSSHPKHGNNLNVQPLMSKRDAVYTCNETAAAAAKSLQSCPTLCDPTDSSPPGSPIPGILQARTLEWVAISFSSAWKWEVKVTSLSRIWLLATPWTAAYQAPLSMGFSRQEYWSGVPLPSPNETAFSNKKEWSTDVCYSMDEPWRHYAKWQKADTDTIY